MVSRLMLRNPGESADDGGNLGVTYSTDPLSQVWLQDPTAYWRYILRAHFL
jgi:hypothetical protein